MGISPRTVTKLGREGYDAVHLVEEGLEKLEDREILTFFQKKSPTSVAG